MIDSLPSEPLQKPNILLINVDDLGFMDVGFNGSQFYDTPNIDALAAQGVSFVNSYACASNCAPSRASLLTSKHPTFHKIYTVDNSDRGKASDRKIVPIPNNEILNPDIPTIADLFSSAGYKTATIGKFHVGENPTDYGFDTNIAGSLAGHPASYFSPYNIKNLKNGRRGEHLPDRLTTQAISFMKDSNQSGEPFFLYLPYYSVHTPIVAKRSDVRPFKRDKRLLHPRQQTYAAMIASLDKNIGRLTQFLTQSNLNKNTIVVFTSDNGGMHGFTPQTPLRAGKGSYYEGGIKIPLVLHYNALQHRRLEAPVSHLDLLPTLASLAGIHYNPTQFDGIDLSYYLSTGEMNREVKERSLFFHFPIYLESYQANIPVPTNMDCRDLTFRTRPGSALIHNGFKLIRYYEDKNDFELFDLANDPSEQNNLASEKPILLDELQSLLNNFLISEGAEIP